MTDNKNFESNVEDFLGTPQGKKLISKKPALEKLANSTDGQKVKEMLGGMKIEEAAKSGDIASLASAIQNALKTEEGARLASQLKELMK